MRRLADRAMGWLARLLVQVFFRSVEVQYGENLPTTGPVVLVANHTNGLVDGLLLMATLSRYPRFLGKSTLFRIAPLWPFLKLAGVIPVYRAIDGVEGDHNVSAFAVSRGILRRDGVVAIFPEGISHDEASLQPLRTGAARIALEARFDDGAEDVVTLAVGLAYDAKARFRSRALVRVGQPVSIADWANPYEADSHEAVRQLTDDLAHQLTDVSPSYSSWATADLFSRIAEVVVRAPEGQLPSTVALADRVEMAEKLSVAEHDGVATPPRASLVETFATYERDLDLLGLDDAQVVAAYPRSRLRRSLAWSLCKVACAIPVAAAGVIVHVIPFQIVKQLAKQPTNEGIKATVKLLGCTVLFCVVYVALGLVVSHFRGPWVGLTVAVLAPFCGYTTVRLAERVKRIGGVLEGYRTVRRRGSVLDIVLADRRKVLDAAQGVVYAP
jgi:glycerol-3-phosphate O-acyltransferase / dihydroxyacetone phosphate acyltransferase